MNGLELRNQIATDKDEVLKTLKILLESSDAASQYSDQYLEKVLHQFSPRICSLGELLSPHYSYLWSQPSVSSLKKISMSPNSFALFVRTFEYSSIDFESGDEVSAFLKNYCSSSECNMKNLMRDLRLATCGIEVNFFIRY